MFEKFKDKMMYIGFYGLLLFGFVFMLCAALVVHTLINPAFSPRLDGAIKAFMAPQLAMEQQPAQQTAAPIIVPAVPPVQVAQVQPVAAVVAAIEVKATQQPAEKLPDLVVSTNLTTATPALNQCVPQVVSLRPKARPADLFCQEEKLYQQLALMVEQPYTFAGMEAPCAPTQWDMGTPVPAPQRNKQPAPKKAAPKAAEIVVTPPVKQSCTSECVVTYTNTQGQTVQKPVSELKH